jgi:hypothetical protein
MTRKTSTITALLFLLTCLLPARGAAAEGGNTITVAITKVGKDYVTVRPAVGSEGHFGVWDMKLNLAKSTAVETLNGKNQLKYLKKGMVAEVSFTSKPVTKTTMIPIFIKVGNTTVTNYITSTTTEIQGDMLKIEEVPGRCTSKSVKLGGRGEKTTVGMCRTNGNWEVIVNATSADHADEVGEALSSATLNLTDAKVKTNATAKFTGAGSFAHATIPGAPSTTTSVKVSINMDGPNDGKPAIDYWVTRSSRV